MGIETIETERLCLRPPEPEDADAIHRRYSSDPEVVRFLAWGRHRSVDDAHAFVDWAVRTWEQNLVGPYLAFERETGVLVGSTGLDKDTWYRASTGYVLARDAWGRGYASEMLRAMIALSEELDVKRLYALCHAEHLASAHVLEKAGFALEGTMRKFMIFPNLGRPEPSDVRLYARVR
ncbi:MAG: GNAT family N-acetyltransferase [Polyangiales bacterium]